MFNLHNFVMSTLRGMSRIYPQWQVQQIALGYYSKGWISENDLAEIESWYAEPDTAEPDDAENE